VIAGNCVGGWGRRLLAIVAQDFDAGAARRLLAAILLRAVKDAQHNDAAALAWLATDGAEWAGDLDIAPDRVRRWAARPNPKN